MWILKKKKNLFLKLTLFFFVIIFIIYLNFNFEFFYNEKDNLLLLNTFKILDIDNLSKRKGKKIHAIWLFNLKKKNNWNKKNFELLIAQSYFYQKKFNYYFYITITFSYQKNQWSSDPPNDKIFLDVRITRGIKHEELDLKRFEDTNNWDCRINDSNMDLEIKDLYSLINLFEKEELHLHKVTYVYQDLILYKVDLNLVMQIMETKTPGRLRQRVRKSIKHLPGVSKEDMTSFFKEYKGKFFLELCNFFEVDFS